MATTPRGGHKVSRQRGTGCAAGRARRPRRAARRERARCTQGTPALRARGRSGDAGRRGRRPLPQTPRGRHAPVPPRRGAGMRRLVGRDVLGAPRAGDAHAAQGDVHAARTGTFRGRGPPRTSAPTTNVPVAAMRPCRPGGGTGCAAGRARRPRRAARRGTRTLCARGRPCRAHGDVPGDAGRRGRRPLPCDIKPTHGYSRNFHASGGYRIVVTFRGNLTLYQTFSHFIECPRHSQYFQCVLWRRSRSVCSVP